ncbi:MAG: hypothetical protein HQM13_22690 [SAR324 cluster bacterium]|nr:hypothetical protein [SAR324 cluster bacterium]
MKFLHSFSSSFLKSRLVRESFVVLLGCVVITAAFTSPIFVKPDNLGIQDWDEHFFYHAVPRQSILEYQQFPLWNPYYCGGSVMLANPQSRILSPFFFLILIFGTVVGLKAEIFLHFVIGMVGCYVLARTLNLDRLSAWALPLIYMLSSMFSLPLTVGMTWFLSVAYVPWAIFCYLKSFSRPWFLVLSSICLVIIFFEGGAYTLTITLLFYGAFAILNFKNFGITRSVIITASIGLLFLAIGAVKIFPAYDFLQTHPRHLIDYSGYSMDSLWKSLFDRNQTVLALTTYAEEQNLFKKGFWSGMNYGMDETGAYVSWIGGALFLIGIGVYGLRQWRWTFIFLFFLWLSIGNRAIPSLWEILHQFPVFDTMRVAQRFRIIFVLCFALFAGLGLQALKSLVSQKCRNKFWGNSFALLLLILLLSDLLLVNRETFKDAFPFSGVNINRADNRSDFIQISKFPKYDINGFLKPNTAHLRSSYSTLYPAFQKNIGVVDYECFGNPDIPKNAIPFDRVGYKGEVYLEETEGKALVSEWTPNRLIIKISASNPGFLVINQNYYPGWHTTDRHQVESREGLMAVQISPDDETLELYYRPLSFVIGTAVTFSTICILFAAYLTRRRWVEKFPNFRRIF